ncbi:MAG: F0F1 ATP synthase subunit alpha, partial [Candidatus Omnitrophica bacterium]|nr:F0F1 ATP synthase subunit alpha [Candidatus Omnitrophota bacterium]
NASIKKFESEFYKYMDKEHPEVEHEIETKQELSDDLANSLDQLIVNFKAQFLATLKS